MDAVLVAVDALYALVRGSYGPSGADVLLFSPPDAPLVTADGYAVLRARKQQNTNTNAASPLERVILNAAEGVYRETGDGTTQFILVLHSLLHQLASQGHGGRLDAAERVRMARAIGSLRHAWDTNRLLPAETQAQLIIEEPIEVNDVVLLSPSIFMRTEQVLTTALTGVLGQRVVHQLVELVMEWIFSSMRRKQLETSVDRSTRFLHRHLEQYLTEAPRAIIHVQGGSFSASYAGNLDEFVIRKSLIPTQLPSLLGGGTRLRFVCFMGTIDPTVGSNQIVYEAGHETNPLQAVDGIRVRVLRFLTELRSRHDVRLVVSTEKIEDYVAAACNHLGIACIQYAELEDVSALCSIAGVSAFTNVFDVIVEDINIGTSFHGASVVRHGSSAAVCLRGLQTTSSHAQRPIVPQLVVYASSKGVYKQYYNAILKSLRVLCCLFSLGSPSIRFCRGAGATELMIAKALVLQEQQQSQYDPALRQSTLSLSTALVESVVQLRTNLTHGCRAIDRSRASRQSSRALLVEMNSKAMPERGYVLDTKHAIATKLGSIQLPTLIEADPLVLNILHPWKRTETIVYTVLQTAQMLLRIDGVIRIRRNPELETIGLHETSDNGD